MFEADVIVRASHGAMTRKKFLGAAVFVAAIATAAPADAWMMSYGENQGTSSLVADAVASTANGPLRVRGLEKSSEVYRGWRAGVRPKGLQQLSQANGSGAPDPDFVDLVDFKALNMADMDVAISGHLLAARVDTRSRFDVPVMHDPKWTRIRPTDHDGHVVPWETVRRVKDWLGGAGPVIAVRQLMAAAKVPEPATLALLMVGLVPIILRRRRKA